jgi:hypothetical protein
MLFLLPMPAGVVLFRRRVDVLCVDWASCATCAVGWLRTVLRLPPPVLARDHRITTRISIALHFVGHVFLLNGLQACSAHASEVAGKHEAAKFTRGQTPQETRSQLDARPA